MMRWIAKVLVGLLATTGLLTIVVVGLYLSGGLSVDGNMRPRLALAQLRFLCTGLEKYREANGRYPEQLSELVESGFTKSGMGVDPWGNNLVLELLAEGRVAVLRISGESTPPIEHVCRTEVSQP